jgi:GWxTD domain-containing protein
MNIRNILIATALFVAAASNSFAQLSMAKADWARGPVQYLMTPEESTKWNAVKSDAEADAFVALFWARRDPSPGTPRNEFREEFEARVQYADQNFSTKSQKGSLTDRGRVLVLFGPPTKALRSRPPAQDPSTSTDPRPEERRGETQTWIYEGDVAQKLFGAQRVEFRFVDRLGSGELRLEQPRFDYPAARQRIVNAAITQPNLTAPPTFQKPPAPPVAAPAAEISTVLKTPSLETAIASAKASKPANKGAAISYAEFVSPTGEYYVPLALFIPASAGLTADAADTVFGVIDDASGKRVLAFEEPAKLTASRSDFFVDKTLNLPSGKYVATVGLAKAGAPVLMVSSPLELSVVTKEGTGTSKLLLSNNIYELSEAAPVKSAFAFGKLKIVPKANMVFSNKDELGYFVEVHNPGIDPATNLPKLQMKMDLLDAKGKPLAGSPLSDAQPLPLSGQPGLGQYAIVNAIPLSQMSKPLAPGEYTLKMKIIDTVSKQSYSLEQKFKIAA